MEREVSSAISLSVTMIVLSVIITMSMFIAKIGLDLKNSTFENMSYTAANMSKSQLSSILYHENVVMPTSALYAILCQEHSMVSYLRFTYYEKGLPITLETELGEGGWVLKVNGTDDPTALFMYPEDIISERLNGKVLLNVRPDGSGTYRVVAEIIV